MDWKRLLGILILAGVGIWVYQAFFSTSYATLFLSAPSSVTAGQSFTLSYTINQSPSQGNGWFCLNSYSQSSYCNASSSNCRTPCTYPSSIADNYGFGYQSMYCSRASSDSRCLFDSYGDVADIYGSDTTNWSQVWYVLGDSSNPSSFEGFHLPPNNTIAVDMQFKTDGTGNGRPVVGVCYSGTAPTIAVTPTWDSLSSWEAPVAHFPPGMSGYTCQWYYYPNTDTTPSVEVQLKTTGDTRFAIVYTAYAYTPMASSSYYFDTALESVVVWPVGIGNEDQIRFSSSPSGITCSNVTSIPAGDTGSYSGSTSCSVSSSASGSYTIQGDLYDLSPEDFQAWGSTYSYYLSSDLIIGTDSVTVNVTHPATSVSLSGVSQVSNDTSVTGTVTVSGGTQFDYVKMYVDGTYKGTIDRSDFSCGSSSCTAGFHYSMYGSSDGTHTVTAHLYVNGSDVAQNSASFMYYDLGVQSVQPTQSSVTFQVKGGYDSAEVYVDNSSCVARSWTTLSHSSASSWTTKTLSYTWPSCAATEGTHTVYVAVRDASGHTKTASGTVSVSFDYTLTNPQPPTGTRYYVQSPTKWTLPSTFSIPTSVQYSTTAPSATITEYFQGTQVKSSTVSNSGTFSYTIPASQMGSACGTGKVIQWRMGSAQTSTTVDIYCVYAHIVSPSGTVTLPSSDNQHVSAGAKVTVVVDAESQPSTATFTPTVTVDGQPASQTSCAGTTPGQYCFSVDASGWSCGSTHTVNLSVDADGQLQATDSSQFTVNCAQYYVTIASPTDGTTINTYQPISDTSVTLAVDYASQDPNSTLKVWLNGAERNVQTAPNCTHDACFVLDYQHGLQLGENDVNVSLYDSQGHYLTSDSVTFYVQYWNFSMGEDWDTTPPVFYVIDGGDPAHADSCVADINGETNNMVFNNTTVRWELPISAGDKGAVVRVTCTYGGTTVYEGNYTIQGKTVSPPPASAVSVSPVVTKATSFPVFPAYDHAGPWLFSVYQFSGSSPTIVFSDVYISNGQLCFVPRGDTSHSLTYYAIHYTAFPTSDSQVHDLIAQASPSKVVKTTVTTQGRAYCVALSKSGVIRDVVPDTGTYYFLVLNTQESTFTMNYLPIAFIAVVLIGYMLYAQGGLHV